MRTPRAVPVLFLGVLLCWACASESEPPDEQAATAAAAPAASTVIEHVDVAGAVELLSAGNEVTVLDVRTPGEFESGHLARAINVDFLSPDFARDLAELDPEGTYLLHCATGGRSTKALPLFEEAGFTHVVHLDGGYRAWVEAGQPVEREAAK